MIAQEKARAFLRLPPEALPEAMLIDDIDGGDAWGALRALARGDVAEAQELSGYSRAIRVTAKCSCWTDGIEIEVTP